MIERNKESQSFLTNDYTVTVFFHFFISLLITSSWNLNGLSVHEFVKAPLMKAFIAAHNFDNVCLSRTFLVATIPQIDGHIDINSQPLLTVNHLNNIKQEGVCMYFKESVPLTRQSNRSNVKECLVTEIQS